MGRHFGAITVGFIRGLVPDLVVVFAESGLILAILNVNQLQSKRPPAKLVYRKLIACPELLIRFSCFSGRVGSGNAEI